MPCWYYDRKELKYTPSSKDGIDSGTEMRYRREGARFILDTGIKLGLHYSTYSTGIVYFHRFYMFHSFKEFNRYAMASCCLFLAGKVEETPKKCKDIIKVARGMLSDSEFQDFGKDPREELMTLERILLQTIKFDLQVEHPYKYLLKYAKMLKDTDMSHGEKSKFQDMVQHAWTLINDSLCTTLCLQWEPDIIAVAVMYLASRMSRFDLQQIANRKGNNTTKWYKLLVDDVTFNLLEDICHQVLDLYNPLASKKEDSPPPPPPPPKGKATKNGETQKRSRPVTPEIKDEKSAGSRLPKHARGPRVETLSVSHKSSPVKRGTPERPAEPVYSTRVASAGPAGSRPGSRHASPLPCGLQSQKPAITQPSSAVMGAAGKPAAPVAAAVVAGSHAVPLMSTRPSFQPPRVADLPPRAVDLRATLPPHPVPSGPQQPSFAATQQPPPSYPNVPPAGHSSTVPSVTTTASYPPATAAASYHAQPCQAYPPASTAVYPASQPAYSNQPPAAMATTQPHTPAPQQPVYTCAAQYCSQPSYPPPSVSPHHAPSRPAFHGAGQAAPNHEDPSRPLLFQHHQREKELHQHGPSDPAHPPSQRGLEHNPAPSGASQYPPYTQPPPGQTSTQPASHHPHHASYPPPNLNHPPPNLNVPPPHFPHHPPSLSQPPPNLSQPQSSHGHPPPSRHPPPHHQPPPSHAAPAQRPTTPSTHQAPPYDSHPAQESYQYHHQPPPSLLASSMPPPSLSQPGVSSRPRSPPGPTSRPRYPHHELLPASRSDYAYPHHPPSREHLPSHHHVPDPDYPPSQYPPPARDDPYRRYGDYEAPHGSSYHSRYPYPPR